MHNFLSNFNRLRIFDGIIHNHPSGDSKPSRADIEMTRQVRDAAKPVGIALHDHLVIGRSGHSSMKAMGLI